MMANANAGAFTLCLVSNILTFPSVECALYHRA